MGTRKDSQGRSSGVRLTPPVTPTSSQLKQHPGFRRPGSWAGPNRVLNRRLFLISVLAIAVVIPAAYFWHRWQVQSSASAMLVHVDSLAAEGKTVEATIQLQRYAELVGSEDLDTLLRMVDLLQKADPQTIHVMRHEARYQRRIIDKKPTLTQNRRRLAELLFAIGSFSLAAEEAQTLLRADKNDTTALRVRANSLYAQQEYPQALAAYRQAVKVNPSDVISYARMANCYMRTGDEKLAAGVVDEMVARNPNSGEALFRRYVFQRSLASGKFSVDDLERAIKLEGENKEILLQGADQALADAVVLSASQSSSALGISSRVPLSQGTDKDLADAKFEVAKERYQKVIELSKPGEGEWIRAYLGLGNAFLAAKDVAGAVAVWKKALDNDLVADNFQLNYRLVEAMLQTKELDAIPAGLKRLRDNLIKRASQQGRMPGEMVSAERSIDLLEAKSYVVRNEPRKAIPLLKAASKTEFGNPAVTYESLQLLGEIYAGIEEWDAAAESLQRAAVTKPDAAVTRFLLAKSLAQAGRIDEALGIFNVLAQNNSAPPVVWLSLAQLNYRKQLALEPANRNWEPFEKSISACMKHGVGILDVVLLQASYFTTTQHLDKAMGLLLATEVTVTRRAAAEWINAAIGRGIAVVATAFGRPAEKYSKLANRPWSSPARSESYSRIWTGMMELLNVADRPTTADWMAIQGVKWWPDSVAMTLAAANLQAGHGKIDVALKTIDSGLERIDEQSHASLLRIKSRLLNQIDDRSQLIDVRLKLAKSEPDNVDNLIALCEDLTRAKRFQDAEKFVTTVKEMEGEEGTNWRYALAILKLARRETGSAEELQSAATLSQEILNLRPTWSRGQLLGALIAMQQNNPDKAIEFYKRTIQYGNRQSDVYQQLLNLLVARGELREAEQYMNELKQTMAGDPSLLPLTLQLTTGRKDYAQAQALAQQNVDANPNDARARLWLGDVQALNEKFDDAIASYHRSIELDPKNVDSFLGALRLLTQLKREEEAKKLVEQLKTSPAIGERGDLVLGYAYTLLAELPDLSKEAKDAYLASAQTHYVAATDKLPKDPAALRTSIEFLVKNGMPEAEGAIKKLEVVSPGDSYLRRARALWKSAQPDAKSWQEALDLMADQDSSHDLRVRALLLERMGGPDELREAIRLLEKVVARTNEVTSADRYKLASLYYRDGKLESAIGHMQSIVFRDDAEAAYIRSCLELLLQSGRWQGETEVLLKRLEKAEPNSLRTQSLRVRWLDLAGRRQDAIAKVKDMLEQGKEKPSYSDTLFGCGQLLTQLGQLDEAEKVYRTFDRTDPNGFQHLSTFLVEQRGKGDEAVKICLAKFDALGPSAGLMPLLRAANISAFTPVSAELEERIDTLLQKPGQSPSDDQKLARARADRQLRKGKYEEAVSFYKKSLAAKPSNASDRNNYAIALSKLGRNSEALQQIDQAISIAGPKIELLDSKGTILLEGKDVNGALNAFNKVTTDARASAVHYLHLAYACKKANRALESRTALEKAKEKGFNAQRLSEEDRRMYAELSGLEDQT